MSATNPSLLIAPDLAALIIENAREYAFFTMDLEGVITHWSPGAERITGYPAPEAVGMNVSTLFTPSDTAASIDRLELDTAIQEGRAEDSRWHVRRDGEWFWANGVTMLFERSGTKALLKIIRDETAAKLAAEHRILLLNELNHRIKNTLATVQSIAEQTLRSGAVDAATRANLTGRLMALSSAHDVLVQESWAGAGLADVVEQATAAYQTQAPAIEITGPPVRLSSNLAVSIAMALHELARNAVKYGAPSRPEGRVSISWTDAHDRAGHRFVSLLWAERGGPPVSPPQRQGFGTRLLDRIFAEGGGQAVTDFAPEGVRCAMSLPLLQAEAAPMLKVTQDPRRGPAP